MALLVKDRLPIVKRHIYNVIDDALKESARDIHRNARDRAPIKQGMLRAESDFHREGFLHQRVSFWIEYARFQEFGGDGARRVKKYTTAGTGKRFLKTAGDDGAKKLALTIKKHTARVR